MDRYALGAGSAGGQHGQSPSRRAAGAVRGPRIRVPASARRVDGHAWRLLHPRGALWRGPAAGRAGARRPGGDAAGKECAHARGHCRGDPPGHRLPAAQHRVYTGRGRLFPDRCRCRAPPLRRRERGHTRAGRRRGGGAACHAERRWNRQLRRPRWTCRDAGRAARRRRPCRPPLYLGHDRPVERRDAQPRQPPVQRQGAGGCLALHRRGRPASRPADLPYPRPVRCHQRRLARGLSDDLPAPVRCRRGDPLAAARDDDDGGSDLLHPASRRSAPEPRPGREDASLHLGLGAASGRNPPAMGRANGPPHSRTLRHDRDEHDHLQSL